VHTGKGYQHVAGMCILIYSPHFIVTGLKEVNQMATVDEQFDEELYTRRLGMSGGSY